MIDSHCSLTPGVETEDKPPVFLGGTAHLPRSACSPVSLRSTGGFFMPHKDPLVRKEYLKEHDRKRWLEKKKSGTTQNDSVRAIDRLHHETRSHISLREKCDLCKAPAVDRHHADYSKPLEVMHLCRSCHMKIHMEERENERNR